VQITSIFIVIVVIFTCEVVTKLLAHFDKFVVQKIIRNYEEQPVFLEQDVDNSWESTVIVLTGQDQSISVSLKSPDHLWHPPTLLFSGYQGSFSGSKVAGP
jgi:hypothetical protein